MSEPHLSQAFPCLALPGDLGQVTTTDKTLKIRPLPDLQCKGSVIRTESNKSAEDATLEPVCHYIWLTRPLPARQKMVSTVSRGFWNFQLAGSPLDSVFRTTQSNIGTISPPPPLPPKKNHITFNTPHTQNTEPSSARSSWLIIRSSFPCLWCRYIVDKDCGNLGSPSLRVTNWITRRLLQNRSPRANNNSS